LANQALCRQRRSDPGARNAGAAGAAIGLDNVAIQVQRALTQRLKVEHRAQAAADKALDFLRAPTLLAPGRLSI
jgi:hypothetical protein